MNKYHFLPFSIYPWQAESRGRVRMVPISKVKALEMGPFKVTKRPDVSQEYT